MSSMRRIEGAQLQHLGLIKGLALPPAYLKNQCVGIAAFITDGAGNVVGRHEATTAQLPHGSFTLQLRWFR